MKLFGVEVRAVPRVAVKSASELWVTKDGRRMTIGEMSESHAKHALALIMRNVRAGHRLGVDGDGRIRFAAPLADLSAWEGEIERLFEADGRFDAMAS